VASAFEHDELMDEATTRANLLVARHAEVTDPVGQVWTVHIIRNGDPRDPFVRNSNLYYRAVNLNQLRRLLRRDRSWNVELMPGPLRDDRTESAIRSVEPTKKDAPEAAVKLVQKVQAGTV
jgi:hypothetical protein